MGVSLEDSGRPSAVLSLRDPVWSKTVASHGPAPDWRHHFRSGATLCPD